MQQEREREARRQALEEQLSIPNVVEGIQSGLLVLGAEELHFTETMLLDRKISLRIPTSFTPMPEEYVAIKYPAARRPKYIFTDDSLCINVNVNPTENRMYNDEMKKMHTELMGMLGRMQPNASWLEQDVLQLGECMDFYHEKQVIGEEQKQVGFYECITPAMDGSIYSLTFFIAYEEKGLFFSLNCTEKHMKLWRPIAHGIMASLRVYVPDMEGGLGDE